MKRAALIPFALLALLLLASIPGALLSAQGTPAPDDGRYVAIGVLLWDKELNVEVKAYYGSFGTPMAPSQTPTRTPAPTPTLAPTIPPTNTPRPTTTPALPDRPTDEPTPTPETTALPPVTPGPGKSCELKVNIAAIRVRREPSATSAQTGTITQAYTFNALEFTTSPDYLWARHDGGWSAIRDNRAGAWWVDASGDGELCQDVPGWPPGLDPPRAIVRVGIHALPSANGGALAPLLPYLGTVKGVDNAGILRQAEAANPDVVTVFRSWNAGDCPSYGFPPEAWAQIHIQAWEHAPADYYEYINECGMALDVDWNIRVLEYVTARGYCTLAGSFSAGTPEPEQWAAWARLMRWMMAHPCQDGRLHGVALHAYPIIPGTTLDNVWLFSRFKTLCAATPEECRTLPIYMTEHGWYLDERAPVDCAALVRSVEWSERTYAASGYNILGYHLWNFGSGTVWRDATNCVPALVAALR